MNEKRYQMNDEFLKKNRENLQAYEWDNSTQPRQEALPRKDPHETYYKPKKNGIRKRMS